MASGRRASRSSRNGARRGSGGNGACPPQAYDRLRREQLDELQRARIIRAMFDVACERGAGDVSVAHVVERSGVSRRTFYELFSDREDCFFAAFEQALTYASERVLPAFEAEKGWREKIRAGLVGLLSFLDEEPLIGRLLIVESHGGGAATAELRDKAIAALTEAIDEGRAEVKAGVEPPSLTAEGIVGGALSVIHSRITQESHESLIALASPLMSMIVLPYMGAAAARRELERAVPASNGTRPAKLLASDPFKEAGMRITYRTVRVLTAIAEHPGASNRLIGDAAEIRDQGQVSKLLARLQRGGLIANTGLTPGKGAPNSWALTPNGQRVVSTVGVHAEGHTERGSSDA